MALANQPLYIPGTLSADMESQDGKALQQFLSRELQKLSIALNSQPYEQFEPVTAAPPRPGQGMVVYADGVGWNPGAGAGLYVYTGSLWLPVLGGRILVAAKGVNFNAANSDTTLTIPIPPGFTQYVVTSVRIGGASHTLVTATCSLWTGAGGTGTAIVASGSAITVSATTAGSNNNTQSLTIANQNTEAYSNSSLFFRVQTAEGAAATATVVVEITPVAG